MLLCGCYDFVSSLHVPVLFSGDSPCSRPLKGKGKGFWAQEKCEDCTRKEGVISTFTWLMFIMQKTISLLYGRHFPPSFSHISLAPRPTFPFLLKCLPHRLSDVIQSVSPFTLFNIYQEIILFVYFGGFS